LYVFDATKGTLYRFPRVEGGFGEGTSWLKTPLPNSSAVRMSVNDTIRFTGATVEQYSKGTREKTLSDKPFGEIALSSSGNFTLAANKNTGEITIWNTDGNAVAEKTLSEIQDSQQIGYDEAGGKLI